MKIEFWGATDDVTGSMTFLNFEEGLVLIDCGMAQGTRETEELNYLKLPVKAQDIRTVIVTHAHLDHSGYLPRLVKAGFKGTIYCTPPTAKLMRIILLDSAKLNYDNFYGLEDVQSTLKLVRTKEWGETFSDTGAQFTLLPVGHILGASSVKISAEDKTIVFSGDLGRGDDPILPDYLPCPEADLIVMESTYGGKNRKGSLEKDLYRFLATISHEGRVGIIASFAVARAQMLLTLISKFFERHPEMKVRLYYDSPMMAEANKVYQQFAHLTRFPESVYSALEQSDAIKYQREWDSLRRKDGPLIIISSSGMVTGGRIYRHLYNWQDDETAILFLPGFQGESTPGRNLKEGKRELLGPLGDIFTWKGEVWSSEEFSSHADQNDLLRWVGDKNKKASVFLLHGEMDAKTKLKEALSNKGFTSVTIPERGKAIDI